MEHGLHRGERVGLLIGDDEPLEWLVSYHGIHKAGAVAVPLLARLAPTELASILTHAGASVVLCSEVHDEICSVVRTVVSTTVRRYRALDDFLSNDESDLQQVLHPDDVADIMFTSGTTGRPRGVVVRHGGLSTTERVPSAFLGLGFISSSPFATTSGSLLVCGPMRSGLSGCFLPRFDPDRWIAAVERDRPVAGFLVPAMVELIVASPRFETADLSSLAVITIGSAPIAAATLRHFGAGLPSAEILCGYGLTEFGAVTSMPVGDGGAHLGSVGLPLPGVELRIVDSAGTTLASGEVGQVAIGGSRHAALVPRGPRRDRARLGRRVAHEWRPRLRRRRRAPLDSRSPEGDHHPGWPQRGARRGGGRPLRAPGRRRGSREGRGPPRPRRGRCSLGGAAPTRRPQTSCDRSSSPGWPTTKFPVGLPWSIRSRALRAAKS